MLGTDGWQMIKLGKRWAETLFLILILACFPRTTVCKKQWEVVHSTATYSLGARSRCCEMWSSPLPPFTAVHSVQKNRFLVCVLHTSPSHPCTCGGETKSVTLTAAAQLLRRLEAWSRLLCGNATSHQRSTPTEGFGLSVQRNIIYLTISGVWNCLDLQMK